MPTFLVSVINHSFTASDEHEVSSTAEAGQQGLASALAIGTAEVMKGERFFGAEVRVERSGKTVGRFMVSVGATPLQ